MATLPKKIRIVDALSDLPSNENEAKPVALSNRDAKPSRSPANDDTGPDLWAVDDFDPSEELGIVREVIEGVLPENGICGLAGQSQSGKTVVALDMAKALVLGVPWLKAYPTKKCGVLYIPYESAENVKRRWRAVFIDSIGKTDDVPFRIIRRPPTLTSLNAWEGFAMTLAVMKKNYQEDYGVPLKVVMIDTLAASGMVAKENEADSWSVVIDNLNAICAELNIIILLLHHAAKSQESENIWRGSSSSYAALEAVIGVKVEKREGEVTRRWLFVDKSKDGDTGYLADLSFEAVKVGVKESGKDMFAPVLRADTDGESKMAAREAEDKKVKDSKETRYEPAFVQAIKTASENVENVNDEFVYKAAIARTDKAFSESLKISGQQGNATKNRTAAYESLQRKRMIAVSVDGSFYILTTKTAL